MERSRANDGGRARHPLSDINPKLGATLARVRATLRALNRTQAQFLLTDAQLGLTFIDIAHVKSDPVGARLSLSRAREALDMVNIYLSRLRIEASQRDAVERARDELEFRLHEAQRRLSTGTNVRSSSSSASTIRSF